MQKIECIKRRILGDINCLDIIFSSFKVVHSVRHEKMFFPTSRVIIRNFKPVAVLHRTIKSSAFSNVVETDDRTCFVCWHPERKFPYEFTRPLPQPSEKSAELTDSPLKSIEPSDVYEVFKEKTPEAVREELMKITHTTKHRWFPRARDKYAKKTPRDREYL